MTENATENKEIKNEEQGLFDWAWGFFGELKIGISLLIITAAASAIGMFIIQKAQPEEYIQTYGLKLFNLIGGSFLKNIIHIDHNVDPQKYVDAFGGWMYHNLQLLGLTNVYGSWWFLLLLFMLGFSLLVCSINRFKVLMESGKKQPRDFKVDALLKAPNSARVPLGGQTEQAAAAVRAALGKFGYKMNSVQSAADKIDFNARKGQLRLWGSFITHVSFLVVFAGALFGKYGGFESYAQINEGGTYFEKKGGYWLKLNDFAVDFDKMGRPLEYTSDLSVYENEKEVLRKTIEVNHPLIYKGIYFYQSSFGLNAVEVKIEGGSSDSIVMQPNAPAVVAQGMPQLFFGSDDVLADKDEPRIFLRVVDDSGGVQGLGWLTRKTPLQFGPVSLYLGDILEFTGLSVKQDPGIPVIWFGCTIMVIGMFMMFYIRTRQVWGAVHKMDDGRAYVTFAGAGGRGDEDFEAEFKKIEQALAAIK